MARKVKDGGVVQVFDIRAVAGIVQAVASFAAALGEDTVLELLHGVAVKRVPSLGVVLRGGDLTVAEVHALITVVVRV